MNSITRLLLWRYLRQSTDTHQVSTMVYVCFLGIFIASFSLVLVMAVMRGFEHTLQEKMQGIHAHLIMKASGEHLNVPAIQQVLTQQFPEVIAASPTTFEHALIRSDNTSDHAQTPTVVTIQAIDIDSAQKNGQAGLRQLMIVPAQDGTQSTTQNSTQNITHNITHDISQLLAGPNAILMGRELALQLGVTVGDTVELLHTGNEIDSRRSITHRSITLDMTEAHVSALFTTGIDEYDSALIITSFDFLRTIIPDSAPTQLNLTLHNLSQEQRIIKRLADTFKLEVFSWKKWYPALVSALMLEKYAMLLILSLIMLMASINIVSLLIMFIGQKKPDIALLQAMGTPRATIEQLFTYIGMTITLSAALPGMLLAAGTSFVLDHYQLIALPGDAYYVTYLPAHVEWHMLIIVFLVIIMISFMSVKGAVRATHTIPIAHVLRFEA